ncbi:hypothetical protein [Paraburkholderia hospita]|uniref:hypothetical protein n=1 Tax=Paraburkholderia hospita TaxID=169430 RepID=UPI0002719C4E|nr:hypothetical protein [Paraburkholderia hospita]EUC18719.1 hypothetical protein PMI06_003095 [Burkholderia sp. BT03]SKC62196.1 hypothetical protein SAMN06266956_1246 [Paraburkholderia hospita]
MIVSRDAVEASSDFFGARDVYVVRFWLVPSGTIVRKIVDDNVTLCFDPAPDSSIFPGENPPLRIAVCFPRYWVVIEQIVGAKGDF